MNFCQDQLHHTLNNKWLVYRPYNVLRDMKNIKNKFIQTVKVLECVSTEDDFILPHIFDHGFRLSSDGYV